MNQTVLKILIGRSSACDYIIEDFEQYGTVSGRHATISETDNPDSFLFEDHSMNGSYVNGQLLHNNSCIIKIGDHVTLGRSYVLPLDDIVKRYFGKERTTKKKPKGQPSPIGSGSSVTPPSSGGGTPQRPIINADPVPVKSPAPPVELPIKEVPKWYWILYFVSIIVAFIIGLCM